MGTVGANADLRDGAGGNPGKTMLGQGIGRFAGAATAGNQRSTDLSWPQGASQRELAIDALWLVFFLGALGLVPPFEMPVRLETLVWFPADLVAVATVWLRPGPFLLLARRNMLLLTWPMLAILSTLWSIEPSGTLYTGLQLLMTMLVGILLSYHASFMRVLQIYFVALMIAAVLSLVVVAMAPAYGVWAGEAWNGLFRHKNVLGHNMVVAAVTGMCLYLQGWRPKLTAAAVAFAAFMALMSRSGSALVAGAAALTPFLMVFPYRRGYTVFFFTVGLLIAAAAAGMLYVDANDINLGEAALESLGKDSTLTGRTVLWDFGMEAFEERPWSGFGYHAWWAGAGPSVEALREAVHQELGAFHNNWLEVAVAFGVWGPIVMGAAVLFLVIVSLRRFIVSPQFINAWPLVYIPLILILSGAENPMFNNHGLVEVMLVAIGSAGWRREAG
jgi:O-antigen ligase